MLDLQSLGSIWRKRPAGSPERFAMLRYHGLWGPGVRLLQNLRFRNKALLLVVCLMVPMSMLVVQAWHAAEAGLARVAQARTGLDEYRAALAEQAALGTLYDAVDAAATAAALKEEALRAQALSQALAGQGRDDELTRLLSPFLHVRATVLPGLAGRGQDGGVASSAQEREDGLALLIRQADSLRLRVLHLRGGALRDDPRLWSLTQGGLDPLPTLALELQQTRRLQQRLAQVGDAAGVVRLLERAASIQSLLDRATNALQPALAAGLLEPTLTRAQLAEIATFSDDVRRRNRAYLMGDVVDGPGQPPADTLSQRGAAAVQAAQALTLNLVEAANRELAERASRERSAVRATLAMTAAGIALMVYFLVCLNRVVGGGLRELATRVDALARGDLSERPMARGSDEVGLAMTSLGESVRRMSSLFEAVTQGVAAVSHASREVATGNAGLSGRTGDIQRSIGDVGERARSSMEAMNRAGDEVERIASHMREVRADAHRSRKAMGELQSLMQALQNKSREIGRVVLLVESVAHQTRLLSLNASVEAARAGPAGKGFAVVAQEVRELARRSESAAHKIAEIVQDSVNDIETGGLLTERVGDSVRLTDERVAEVSAIMGDIVQLTHAGREHSQEVVGITRNVEDSAGGNARMVEQLAQASAELREQGDHLKRSMQHFVFG